MHTNNIWITEYQQILIKKCSETTGKGKLLCGYSLILLKYVRFQKHFILFMFIFFGKLALNTTSLIKCQLFNHSHKCPRMHLTSFKLAFDTDKSVNQQIKTKRPSRQTINLAQNKQSFSF